MSEEHQGYLESLESELMGQENSLIQIRGLVTQAAEAGDIEKHAKYKSELIQLDLAHESLVAKIKENKQQTANLTEQ